MSPKKNVLKRNVFNLHRYSTKCWRSGLKRPGGAQAGLAGKSTDGHRTLFNVLFLSQKFGEESLHIVWRVLIPWKIGRAHRDRLSEDDEQGGESPHYFDLRELERSQLVPADGRQRGRAAVPAGVRPSVVPADGRQHGRAAAAERRYSFILVRAQGATWVLTEYGFLDDGRERS
jgi:hypothetical protein